MWAVVGASLLGSALADSSHVPAGALLGGMVVAVLAALTLSVQVPIRRPAFMGAQAVLGSALCGSFQPSAWAALAEHWPVALVNVVGVVLVSQGVALLLARLAGLNVRTTALGLMPGGASAMIALSEELDADARLVTLFQYIRVGVVILVTALVGQWAGGATTPAAPVAELAHTPPPLLAWGLTALVAVVGGWLGVWLKLPAGAFIGPLLVGAPLTAFGVPVGTWPPGVLGLAMWALGVRVGGHFDASAVRELRRVAFSAFAAAVVLVAGCVLLAQAWAFLGGVDPLTAYFATSPGGADSVLAIALGTSASLSLVLAVQVGRLLLIFLVAPPVLRRLSARR